MPSSDERKLVTVLFADVAGSTELATRHDAEALRALLSAFFEEMRHQIEAFGGTVEKFAGDAIMAVFGVPGVHEDDAERAVRAAVAMRDAVAQLNPMFEQEYGVRLTLKAESRRLADNLLRVSELPETIREAILARAEGNPFFLEEIIRALIEQGVLRRDGERWVVGAEAASGPFRPRSAGSWPPASIGCRNRPRPSCSTPRSWAGSSSTGRWPPSAPRKGSIVRSPSYCGPS